MGLRRYAFVLTLMAIGVGGSAPAQRSTAQAQLRVATPNATLDLTQARSSLKFVLNGRAATLAAYKLPATVADPNGKTLGIAKILLDPTYIDPSHSGVEDDFQIVARGIRTVRGRVRLTLFALCKWKAGKIEARCAIEDDGGAFQLVAIRRAGTLAGSRFAIRVGGPEDPDGFRFGGTDQNGNGDELRVSPAHPGAVDVPLVFR